MALWTFSKLDMWQIRLRVTGSLHSAETEELGTEDPSDVSAPLRTGSSCHHCWVTPSADGVWQPTARARRGCARRWRHLFCARRWRHLFPQCCVRARCCLCSNAISVPNQCPHTTLQSLRARAGRACWHHTAATGKETLQYPPTCAVMGIWLWETSHPASLQELYQSRSLGPMVLDNTHSKSLSTVWKSLLHLSTSASSHFPKMSRSELDSLHQVCSHAVLTGCWQQPAIRNGAYRTEDVVLLKRNRSLSSSEKPPHITIQI